MNLDSLEFSSRALRRRLRSATPATLLAQRLEPPATGGSEVQLKDERFGAEYATFSRGRQRYASTDLGGPVDQRSGMQVRRP